MEMNPILKEFKNLCIGKLPVLIGFDHFKKRIGKIG